MNKHSDLGDESGEGGEGRILFLRNTTVDVLYLLTGVAVRVRCDEQPLLAKQSMIRCFYGRVGYMPLSIFPHQAQPSSYPKI